MPVMVVTSVVCLPVLFAGGRIDRREGGVFVPFCIGYTGYLILNATGHAGARTFGRAMLWFVVPLTLVTLAVHFSFATPPANGVIAYRSR